MHTITIKKTVLKLDFTIQTSPSGRPIRYSGIEKSELYPEKWIDKGYKNYWVYTFRFMDTKGGFIKFLFDYYDNFVRII